MSCVSVVSSKEKGGHRSGTSDIRSFLLVLLLELVQFAPAGVPFPFRRSLAIALIDLYASIGMALDPKTKKIFLPAAEYQETPASDPGKRPQRTVKPGSFVVLVVGKP